MRNKIVDKVVCVLIAFSLCGCGSGTIAVTEASLEAMKPAQAKIGNAISRNTKNNPDGDGGSEEDTTTKEDDSSANDDLNENGLTKEQQNSFSMMYYLAITAEEIRTSKDNRLALEDIYTSLLNDINPSAIDEISQKQLQSLRDIIKTFLSISTKRERLQFVYNQQKAEAIRSVVPNPIAILSVANSFDWKRLAMTVVYTAVDSYNSYKSAANDAEMNYIMSGWELDDQEKDAVMKNRDRAFEYMVDMAREYHLDGLKTLNEKAIEQFTEICARENPSEKIRLLKSEEDQYSLLGNYWLELADAYFEINKYSQCLESVEKYKELSTGIYRNDVNYLKILPKAIVAAQKVYSGEKYIQVISGFTDDIIKNTSLDDWASRYFAAQSYLDLYSKSKSKDYLQTAYEVILENVTVLLKNQRTVNTTYLKDVNLQEAKEPDTRYMTDDEKKQAEKDYKAEKKRVKEYNNELQKARKTELPSLYEPLVLNCELLFALADELNISQDERDDINNILSTSSNGTFIVKPINDFYSFSTKKPKYNIDFNEDEIIIPANLLTAGSEITVTVTDDGSETVFDDCVVKKVEREEAGKLDAFIATITSKKQKKYQWTNSSEVKVEVKYTDAYDKTTDYYFTVGTFEHHWYGDKVEFVQE